MPIDDVLGPVVALVALLATLIFGVRRDRKETRSRADALRHVEQQRRARAERKKQSAHLHQVIDRDADAARANPEPTQEDFEDLNRKINQLWNKHRGDFWRR